MFMQVKSKYGSNGYGSDGQHTMLEMVTPANVIMHFSFFKRQQETNILDNKSLYNLLWKWGGGGGMRQTYFKYFAFHPKKILYIQSSFFFFWWLLCYRNSAGDENTIQPIKLWCYRAIQSRSLASV